MDIATIIGLLVGSALILGSIMMDGGGVGPFINVPSMMITIGGAFSALLINFPMAALAELIGVIRKCFLTKLPKHEDIIAQFRNFATVARRDGLPALENEIENITDDFMKRGLELVVGGGSKEEISAVLDIEMECIEQRHSTGKKILDALAAGAPAFGMIGTLIGLVQMLRTLDDPSKIGIGMATALLTTLYGAVIANLFCIPMAGKLESRSQEEIMVKELMKTGLCLLVEGQAPSILQERLAAFLSSARRERVFGATETAA
ncbi:MAG: motility protein A [Planctomycetaceae bacterium]|nr:motility protein A [Planctomycetaceae bacterium]MCA9029461.1 motility protein A [Planctomycetaceae bacterium]MCA9042786.1 motility protein A [Planctomycetaceae bacterium]MCB9952606.1 motility protein A [Planctomycetaceae bacterium]